ncbi:MAG: elongation factor P [Candidatus Moranbacteria bacterium]|nr:elongation factor P [Candidatus Moranbacteria bacterium]
MLEISKIKVGQKIKYKDNIFEIVKANFAKIGRQGAVLRAKLKNLKTGNVSEITFRDSDKLEEAEIQRKKAQFLYHDDGEYFFMDNQNFDQFNLNKDTIGNSSNFLIEGTEIEILYYEDEPLNLELPVKMNFKVVEAPPSAKGNTVDGGSKKVKIETGYKLNAPLFIKQGDIIKINTEDGKYVERVQ